MTMIFLPMSSSVVYSFLIEDTITRSFMPSSSVSFKQLWLFLISCAFTMRHTRMVDAHEVVDADLLLDRVYDVGLVVSAAVFNSRDVFFHGDLFLFRIFHLLFGFRGGEVEKTQVVLGINCIEEQVKARAFFLVDEQPVDIFKEGALNGLKLLFLKDRVPKKLFWGRRISPSGARLML